MAVAGVHRTLRHHAFREELGEFGRSSDAGRCPVCFRREAKDTLSHYLFYCLDDICVATREKYRIGFIRESCEREVEELEKWWVENPDACQGRFAAGLEWFRRCQIDAVVALACGGRVIAHDQNLSWIKPQKVRYGERVALAGLDTRFAKRAARLERLVHVSKYLHELQGHKAMKVAERLQFARAEWVPNAPADDDEAEAPPPGGEEA